VIVHRFEPVAPDRTLAVCEWLFPARTLEAGHDVADAHGGVLVPSEAPVISRYYQWYTALMGDACRSTTR
jgi:hypothetical protein